MNTNALCGSSDGSRAHARHQRVFLSLGLETSCFIGQSLADDALDRKVSAGMIVNPELFAVGVPKIELGKVAVQMRFADMEVAADDAALEDRKEALDRIGMERAAHIFLGPVVQDFVPEVAAHVAILPGVVSAEDRSIVNLPDEDGTQVSGGNAGDVHGADTTTALDQRQHGFLAPASAEPRRGALGAVPVLFLAPDESFVGFDGLAFAAERPKLTVLHRFADAVRQEPRGFHAALKHPLDLAGRNALLAGAHQVNDLKPQMQRKVAVLKDGADADGEGAAASVAFAKADAAALALQTTNVFRGRATVWASRSARPKQRFNVSESRFFVVEMGRAQNRLCHGMSPYVETLRLGIGVVKCNTAD